MAATAQICTLSQNGYGAKCCEPNEKTADLNSYMLWNLNRECPGSNPYIPHHKDLSLPNPGPLVALNLALALAPTDVSHR
jgi:hypothetical protein